MNPRHSDLLPGHYDAFGYKSAAYARENASFSAVASTADAEMRFDREAVVNVARQMDRDLWLIEGLLNRAVDYILGPTGFTLQAKTSDPYLNAKIEQEIWPAFARAPEVRGLFDWHAYQALNLRESLVAGDQLNLKIGGEDPSIAGKFQHVESERIGGIRPNLPEGQRLEQGVILDKLGRVVAYNVCDVGASGYVSPSTGQVIAGKDAIFFGQPFKRSSQSRCMPVFVSSLPIAHRLDDILTSEAVAWQVLSRLVAKLKREDNSKRNAIRDGVNATQKSTDSTTQNRSAAKLITDMGMAVLFQAGPNDDLDVVAQNRPNLNLSQAVLTFVRLFCVPIGMPAEVLLMYWPEFNYSSARIVLLQAFLRFRKLQQHNAVYLDSPAYYWQIGRAIADGRLPWRPDILKHEWNVPSWPWIDEDKEVSAWSKKLDRAIATQTEVLASLGRDRQEHQATRRQEIFEAWQAAQQIEQETDGGIKASELWRHLSGLDQGKTEAAVRAAATHPDAEPNTDPMMEETPHAGN